MVVVILVLICTLTLRQRKSFVKVLERVKEHAYKDQESTVNKHLNSCYDTNYLDSKTNNELTDFVMTNSKIIDSSNNWNLLLYKDYTSRDANPS